MIVLDTDVLSIIQRDTGLECDRLLVRLNQAGQPVAVTIVSIEEQLRGWLALIARSQTLDHQAQAYFRLRTLLNDFQSQFILDFDSLAVAEYQRLLKLKIRIGSMDLKIAAITLSQGGVLISRNLGDFRKVPGLVVEDWTTKT